MKPRSIETAQMAKAAVPPMPPMPPIEKRTSAGTPLATQKAPFQSIVRCNSCCPEPVTLVVDICGSLLDRQAERRRCAVLAQRRDLNAIELTDGREKPSCHYAVRGHRATGRR